MQKLREAPEHLKKRARSVTDSRTGRDFETAVNEEKSLKLAIERYPELYRRYCDELRNPTPTMPQPDATTPTTASRPGTYGSALAQHMRAGGKLDSSAPGYREWIDSFRRPGE